MAEKETKGKVISGADEKEKKPKAETKPKAKSTLKPKAKSKVSKEVTLTLVKSGIGKAKDQKATIRGLGFKRLSQTVTLKDTPSVRGMINKISHLVEVQ